MKIIDLLNKIANGENISNNHMKYFDRQGQGYDICSICLANLTYKLDNDIVELNDEIEILEEEKKIPKKLPYYSIEKIQKAKNKDEWQEERITLLEKRVDDLHIKINEIIDYLKSKGE